MFHPIIERGQSKQWSIKFRYLAKDPRTCLRLMPRSTRRRQENILRAIGHHLKKWLSDALWRKPERHRHIQCRDPFRMR